MIVTLRKTKEYKIDVKLNESEMLYDWIKV